MSRAAVGRLDAPGPTPEAPPALSLLVGAEAFWHAFARDLAAATDSAYVQTMTFEADGAGGRLAAAMLASPARDRRLVVDSYSRFTVNDRFLLWPPHLLDRALQAEARATRRLARTLDRRGVRTRFVRPYGPLCVRFAARDHKKIAVVDDRVAYVGGLNFSDHNFAWDDLMLRIDHPGAARLLADDVRATWHDRSVPRVARFDGLALHLLDGRDNERGFEPLRALLAGARRSVWVQAPYVTAPVTGWLDAAARRGVAVTVLTPAANNRPLVQQHVLAELAPSRCALRVTTGMSHVRAMLVDEAVLVLGSSSFSYLSYRCQGEVLAFVTAPRLVEEFVARVVASALARSRPFAQDGHGRLRRRAGDLVVRLFGTIAVALARIP